ncbi:hypothetical protein ADUPG1_011718, partial [Aduncisulcus paluster]
DAPGRRTVMQHHLQRVIRQMGRRVSADDILRPILNAFVPPLTQVMEYGLKEEDMYKFQDAIVDLSERPDIISSSLWPYLECVLAIRGQNIEEERNKIAQMEHGKDLGFDLSSVKFGEDDIVTKTSQEGVFAVRTQLPPLTRSGEFELITGLVSTDEAFFLTHQADQLPLVDQLKYHIQCAVNCSIGPWEALHAYETNFNRSYNISIDLLKDDITGLNEEQLALRKRVLGFNPSLSPLIRFVCSLADNEYLWKDIEGSLRHALAVAVALIHRVAMKLPILKANDSLGVDRLALLMDELFTLLKTSTGVVRLVMSTSSATQTIRTSLLKVVAQVLTQLSAVKYEYEFNYGDAKRTKRND